MRPLAAPLAPLPPGGAIGGPPPPARGQGCMGGLVALRRGRMDRSLLLWAGARGGRSATPRHSPLRAAGRDLRRLFPLPLAPAGGFRVGTPQSAAGATPPRAPKRSGPGAQMAQRDRGQLPPASLRPGRDFVSSLRVVNGTLECPPQEDPHPKHLQLYKTPSSHRASSGAAP